MPQFKIRHHDGGELVVTAARTATNGVTTIFESRNSGAWQVVHHVPNADIDVVQRRIVEASGVARWVNEKPKHLAAPPTW